MRTHRARPLVERQNLLRRPRQSMLQDPTLCDLHFRNGRAWASFLAAKAPRQMTETIQREQALFLGMFPDYRCPVASATVPTPNGVRPHRNSCLLYTSDAADEE